MTNYTIKDKYNAKKQKTDGTSNTHTYIKKQVNIGSNILTHKLNSTKNSRIPSLESRAGRNPVIC